MFTSLIQIWRYGNFNKRSRVTWYGANRKPAGGHDRPFCFHKNDEEHLHFFLLNFHFYLSQKFNTFSGDTETEIKICAIHRSVDQCRPFCEPCKWNFSCWNFGGFYFRKIKRSGSMAHGRLLYSLCAGAFVNTLLWFAVQSFGVGAWATRADGMMVEEGALAVSKRKHKQHACSNRYNRYNNFRF